MGSGETSATGEVRRSVPEASAFFSRDAVVVRDLPLGECMNWTVDGIISKLEDAGQTVSVHRNATPSMDFVNKSFRYEIMRWDEMLKKMDDKEEKEFWYYRALDYKRKPVFLETTSPSLAKDFTHPALPEGAKVHSSVLRLSSAKCQMWLHYDVLDNILCQVRGIKRVILFEPHLAGRLYLDGSSSKMGSSFFHDIDQTLHQFPLFAEAWEQRIEVVLHPGDALAIPSYWCHATSCLSQEGFSCSMNTFYVLPPNETNGNDAWANKDPLKAREAFQLIEKAKAALSALPLDDQRQFFRSRLIHELAEDGMRS